MARYLTKTSTAHVLLKFSSWQGIQWLCLFVNQHLILSIKLQATFSSNSTIEQGRRVGSGSGVQIFFNGMSPAMVSRNTALKIDGDRESM